MNSIAIERQRRSQRAATWVGHRATTLQTRRWPVTHDEPATDVLPRGGYPAVGGGPYPLGAPIARVAVDAECICCYTANMAEAISLRIGAEVVGSDGPLGPLIALIVHPDERRVTHLAVRNGTVPETGRLVPIEEVLRASTDDVELRIDRHHFFTLERLIVPYRIEPAEYATRESAFSLGGAGEFTFAVHELLPEACIAIEGRPLAVDERSHAIGSVERWTIGPDSGAIEGVDVKPRHGRRGELLHFHETMIQRITAVTVTIDRQVASDRGPAEDEDDEPDQGMVTVRIDLEAGDVVLLRDVLAAVVRDMSPEIADTDNAAYRRDLKARRDRLQHVLELLG